MKDEEHQLQASINEWVAWNVVRIPALELFYAVPNGGKRGIVTAAKMKAEGVKRGVFDIAIDYPTVKGGKSGLKIEVKTKTGYLSQYQKVWRSRYISAGFQPVAVRSLDEFIRIVEYFYLGKYENIDFKTS